MGGTDAVCVRGLVVVAADIDFAFFAFPFEPVDFVAVVANLVCEIGVETAVANVAEASRIRLVDIERRARMFNTDASRGQASQAPFRRLAQLKAQTASLEEARRQIAATEVRINRRNALTRRQTT